MEQERRSTCDDSDGFSSEDDSFSPEPPLRPGGGGLARSHSMPACMDGAVVLGNDGVFPPPFKRMYKGAPTGLGTTIGSSARTPFGLSTLREEGMPSAVPDVPVTPICLDQLR